MNHNLSMALDRFDDENKDWPVPRRTRSAE